MENGLKKGGKEKQNRFDVHHAAKKGSGATVMMIPGLCLGPIPLPSPWSGAEAGRMPALLSSFADELRFDNLLEIDTQVRAFSAFGVVSCPLDRDDFGLNQPKIIAIDSYN